MAKHDPNEAYHPQAKRYLERKKGSRLQDGSAHENMHEEWGRRDFLKMTGFAALGSALALSGYPVSAFAPSPVLAGLTNSDCGDRILVMLRLKGGNDGLNTIVQRGNDTYYNIRPTLAQPEEARGQGRAER